MAMSWSLKGVEGCAAMALGDMRHRMVVELAVDLEASEGAGPAGGPTTGATPLQAADLNPHPPSVFKFSISNFESARRHGRTFWKPQPVPNISPVTGDQEAHWFCPHAFKKSLTF